MASGAILYLRDGTGRKPGRDPHPPIRNAHNRSSVGSPLAHTMRTRDPTDAPRRERAGTQPRSHTNGESGRRAQAAARQTGRQGRQGRQAGRQAEAGRQAGRQAGKQGSHGTLLRQRHCLPSARFGLARAAALVRLSRLRRPPRSVLVVLD